MMKRLCIDGNIDDNVGVSELIINDMIVNLKILKLICTSQDLG